MRALFDLLAQQHAVVTTAQARAVGVSTRVQRRLVADGVLVSPGAGLLLTAGCPPTFERRAMAATLLAGVAAIAHGAAARLHGLPGFDAHDIVDVIAAKSADPRATRGMVVRYSRGPIADHTVDVDGIPTLSLAATLVLLAPVAGVTRTGVALGEALARGLDRDELRDTAAAWQQRGRAGPPALLALLRQREQPPSPVPAALLRRA